MEYKEFGENAEIEYNLSATVNGEVVKTSITAYSTDSISEQEYKITSAIEETLKRQWEELSEYED